MNISVNIIAILKAINLEYGNNELIKRLSRILNIDLLFLIDKDIEIIFNKKNLRIISENTIYQITFYSEYYLLTKKENNYLIRHFYDFTGNTFRKTIIFYQDNDDPIILDEINDQQLKNRRLLKTAETNLDLLNAYYEKEISSLINAKVNERYLFKKGQTEKEITTPTNLCTYSAKALKKTFSNPNEEGFLEVSSSINYFPPQFLGRIRHKYELLISSLKKRFPNILIRENIFKDNYLTTYEIEMFKISNIILINLKIINLKTKESKQNKMIFTSHTNSSLTLKDLNLLIKYLENNPNIPFLSNIIEEIIKIKKQILIHHKKRLKDMDIFDFKFNSYPRFEDLAFDIYCNLPYYNRKINDSLSKKDDFPPTLKK